MLSESIIALQKMIKRESAQSDAIILYCARMIEKIKVSGKAKATMIYLLKEFCDKFTTLSKETLRRLIKTYKEEKSESSRLAILNLACKVISRSKDDQRLNEIGIYLFDLALRDPCLQIKQKGRMLKFIF